MGARRFVAALAALAGFAVPAASSASGAEAAPAARFHDRVSNAQVTLRGRPSDSPLPLPSRLALFEALSDAKRDPEFDVRTLGTIARAAIKTYTGVDLPAAAEAQGDQPIHIGFDGGDLDGDGLADVLALVVPPDAPVDLVARRGTDGDSMWAFDLATGLLDVFVQPLHNAAGGTDAVAVTQLLLRVGAGEEACGEICGYGSAIAFTWQLEVLDADTGAVRWTRQWDGAVTEAGALTFGPSAGALAGGVAALNGFVVAMPSDDHDGDGVQDLVIDEVDVLEGFALGDAFTDAGGVIAAGGGFVTATRASVVRTSDGGVLAARASAGPGIAFLSPGVDGVGDATRDLLWDSEILAAPAAACVFDATDATCVGPAAYERALEMIDGRTLLPAWVAPFDTPGWILPADGDLNRDGSQDLSFLRFGQALSTTVLSGADGSALWSAGEVLLGPVGDDHVLGVNVTFGNDVSYVFTRRAGADGAPVGSTEHHVPIPTDAFDLFIIGEFSRIGDADGDGEHDAFAQITIYANTTTVDVGIEHGRSGVPIFQRHSDGEVYAIPVDDANGDARADVLDAIPVQHRRSFALTLRMLTMPDAATAWSRTTRTHQGSQIILDVSDDLEGDGGSDLILSASQYQDEGLRAVLSPSSGLNGATLWEVGGPLAEPPPDPTGGIAGVLTGAGAPFQGACVAVFDGAGNEIAFTVSAAEGAYVTAELEDGSYVLRFGDCLFGTFVEEWYDDAPSMEEATPVVVSGGAVTTGIDADLAPTS